MLRPLRTVPPSSNLLRTQNGILCLLLSHLHADIFMNCHTMRSNLHFLPRYSVSVNHLGEAAIRSDIQVVACKYRPSSLRQTSQCSWVVEAPERPRDLIFGVGRREVKTERFGSSKRFMGYTTAYRNNGAFLTFNGIASTNTQDDYHQQLSEAVSSALSAYRNMQQKQNLPSGDPDRIIFHSFKKISADEIQAVELGIRRTSLGGALIPYGLVHIDQYANYLVFDGGHKTFLPPSGYCVTLGPLHRLLLTEGRERYENRKLGFPAPLSVRLDQRSTLSGNLPDVALELTEQVYRLSKVNWRGFNAATTPITLGYSRLIADVVASCPDPDLWTKIASAENLGIGRGFCDIE